MTIMSNQRRLQAITKDCAERFLIMPVFNQKIARLKVIRE
jgi:hypothetical protein